MGVLRKFGFRNKVEKSAELVASYLRERYEDRVAHGPFKGMQLSRQAWWGTKDASSKLLGVYERQVQEQLEAFAANASVLIDIGAADGYMAIGAVRSGLYERAICFEISASGRQRLRENAEANGVSDRIDIFGEASRDTLRPLLVDMTDAVILCDIEGAEFDLLSEDVLEAARNICLIVELHDPFVANGAELKAGLLERASGWFDTGILKSADIQLSRYPELERFNDSQRLLAFSEGRGRAMEWLVLTPRAAESR
jgi:hypothetical protein